jgi:hypothetical protein
MKQTKIKWAPFNMKWDRKSLWETFSRPLFATVTILEFVGVRTSPATIMALAVLLQVCSLWNSFFGLGYFWQVPGIFWTVFQLYVLTYLMFFFFEGDKDEG